MPLGICSRIFGIRARTWFETSTAFAPGCFFTANIIVRAE